MVTQQHLAFTFLNFMGTLIIYYIKNVLTVHAGTKKLGTHIINSHIDRPRMTINLKIGSLNKDSSQSHIRKIAG
jgi:hypothetical protein